MGTAPNRRFVVEYNDIPNFGGGGGNKTFEIVFYEGSNAIRFQYLTASDDPFGFGIESPDQTMGMGNAGAGDLFISPVLVEDQYAIEFSVTPDWLEVNVEERKIVVSAHPRRDQIDTDINEQLIVELYSK